jgi:hypothetical protein
MITITNKITSELRPSEDELPPEVMAKITAAMQAEVDAQAARFFYGPPKPDAPRCNCPSYAFWHQPNCPVGNRIT